MKSVEFVLWANGAAELIGDEPPTKEQWLKLREKLGEAVGTVVASKLLEKAEEVVCQEERARDEMSVKQMMMELQVQKMAAYRPYYGTLTGTAVAGPNPNPCGEISIISDNSINNRSTFLSRFRSGLTGGKTS